MVTKHGKNVRSLQKVNGNEKQGFQTERQIPYDSNHKQNLKQRINNQRKQNQKYKIRDNLMLPGRGGWCVGQNG